MERRVEAELLDSLPADDPRAIRGRADLRRLNGWMGHASIVAREIARWGPAISEAPLVEIGSGCGCFALEVARRLASSGHRGRKIRLVDRVRAVEPATLREFGRLGWSVEFVQADVFDWMTSGRLEGDGSVVFANLFLHHFVDEDLRRLLVAVAGIAGLFVACEPRRSAAVLAASRLVGLIGCGALTRHDAVASVRAGFRRSELSGIWPERRGWRIEEGAAGWCSQLFRAVRVGDVGAR